MAVAVTSAETLLKHTVPEGARPRVSRPQASPARGTGAFQGGDGVPLQTMVPPKEQVALVALVSSDMA